MTVKSTAAVQLDCGGEAQKGAGGWWICARVVQMATSIAVAQTVAIPAQAAQVPVAIPMQAANAGYGGKPAAAAPAVLAAPLGPVLHAVAVVTRGAVLAGLCATYLHASHRWVCAHLASSACSAITGASRRKSVRHRSSGT